MDKADQKSLRDVHNIIKKWLFLSDDTIIDVILAAYLTNQKKGTPVWLFIVDSSGETKSELLKPLLLLDNVELLDDITVSGITSGKEGAEDLFRLCDKKKNIVLLILDIATLSAKKKDDMNQIWAKFRNMFDGILAKRTGFKSKAVMDAHVTMIGAGTKRFRSQYIINQQLGTRELLFTPKQQSAHMLKKLEAARKNDNYEPQMRLELIHAYTQFLTGRKLKTIEWDENPELNAFFDEQVLKLRILRATGDKDWRTGHITGEIDVEMPTRVMKQLKRLYEGLRSLDEKYGIERAKRIIRNVVDSSGNQLRLELFNIFENEPDKEFTLAELSRKTKTHKKLLTAELDVLWKLDWLKRETREERIGAYMQYDPIYDKEYLRGGKITDVHYYWRAIG